MAALWAGIAVALIVSPLAFLLGRIWARRRARQEQEAQAELSRALHHFLNKTFPRAGQQYGTMRREEAEELLLLLLRCDQLAGTRPEIRKADADV